ncbi:metallophosphoesterase [Marinobacter salinexigens]|uniref:Metallophosphoesterase n=1 Tax=Marinobacter salinexigens TaxID=2919747 RepID=A0A5B0VJ52_9GAMM|nr:metallophosphoesterase [Marinobacter salinexigens]KAA1173951.1 metallophosphoesterase [Marinobacter salinexigens]
MYDLIGDIHGYAEELKALLAKMDYREIDGVWQHSERKVIFLGDFVDRGPAQIETVNIARSMVESGNALAVMGNHEFNAVAWATEDPQNAGEYLRPHNDKNLKQHKAFLEQVGEGSELHRSLIEWFKTLPVYLELPEFRVVHACWHPDQIAAIAGYVNADHQLLPQTWEQASRKGTEAYEAIETLLKGLEIPLPGDHHFFDKDDNKRTDIRTEWWRRGDLTYRDLAMVPEDIIEKIPHTPVEADVLPGYDGKKPVFVGHYWLNGKPQPLNEHIACLDYSVAGKSGGKLCAYRFGGEQLLSADGFEWVCTGDRMTGK